MTTCKSSEAMKTDMDMEHPSKIIEQSVPPTLSTATAAESVLPFFRKVGGTSSKHSTVFEYYTDNTPGKNGHTRHPHPNYHPQDRSIDSSTRVSAASHGSESSKFSTATATATINPHNISSTTTMPVTSPPFPLMSPAIGRKGTGISSSPSIHNGTTMNMNTTRESFGSIVSPPKVKKSFQKKQSVDDDDDDDDDDDYNDHKDENKMNPKSKTRIKSTLDELRKEIHELTSQFAKMEQESQQRRSLFLIDPQDRFDESLGVMGEKADAIVDALYRNYTTSSHLSRENRELKRQIENMLMGKSVPTTTMASTTGTNIETSTPPPPTTTTTTTVYDAKENINHYDKKNNHNNNHDNHDFLQEKSSFKYKSSKALLNELDSSDNYVQRTYPPVPKTPGTMFTTELVEVMSLDVGEHAYLAQLMDRQWKTTTDYRPKVMYNTKDASNVM